MGKSISFYPTSLVNVMQSVAKFKKKSHRNFLKLSPEISSESLFILDEFLPSSRNNKIFSSLEGCKFLQGLGNMKYEVTHGPER